VNGRGSLNHGDGGGRHSHANSAIRQGRTRNAPLNTNHRARQIADACGAHRLAQAKKWEHPGGESAGHQCQLQHHIPVALPRVVAGRSPDSQDLTRRLPRRAQWHCGAPALAYRCGGSRGLAPGTQGRTAFPFNCRRRNHPQHLRTSRIISAKFQRSSRDEPDHGSCKRCRSNGTFKPMELSDKF